MLVLHSPPGEAGTDGKHLPDTSRLIKLYSPVYYVAMKSNHACTVRMGRPKSPEKREAILAAAADLFLRRGLQQTSMDAVAEEAGVSKQTLYSHFEGKDALFRQVIRDKVENYQFSEEGVASLTGDAGRDLQAIGRQFLELLFDPEVVNMMRVVIGESAGHRKIARLFYETGPDKTIRALTAYLAEQHRAGALRVDAPRDSANLFLNMLRSEWHLKLLMNLRPRITRQALTRHIQTTVDQFLSLHRP